MGKEMSDKITIPEIAKVEKSVRCGDSPVELCDFFECYENSKCDTCAVSSAENFNKWKESLKE